MPMHIHQCEICNKRETVMNSVGEDPVWPECCGDVMPRVHMRGHETGAFSQPIEMYSVALNDDQEIREFRARNPTAEVADDPRHPLYGVPIARTRQEKMRILKNEGFVEKN